MAFLRSFFGFGGAGAGSAVAPPLAVYFAIASTKQVMVKGFGQPQYLLDTEHLRYFRLDFPAGTSPERMALLTREFATQLQPLYVAATDSSLARMTERSPYKAFTLIPIGGTVTPVRTYAISDAKLGGIKTDIFSRLDALVAAQKKYAGSGFPMSITEVNIEGELGVLVLNCTVNGGKGFTWNVANKAFIFVRKADEVYTHPDFPRAFDLLTEILIAANLAPGRYQGRTLTAMRVDGSSVEGGLLRVGVTKAVASTGAVATDDDMGMSKRASHSLMMSMRPGVVSEVGAVIAFSPVTPWAEATASAAAGAAASPVDVTPAAAAGAAASLVDVTHAALVVLGLSPVAVAAPVVAVAEPAPAVAVAAGGSGAGGVASAEGLGGALTPLYSFFASLVPNTNTGTTAGAPRGAAGARADAAGEGVELGAIAKK